VTKVRKLVTIQHIDSLGSSQIYLGAESVKLLFLDPNKFGNYLY